MFAFGGFLIVVVLALAAPMMFGKPFGWFGRLWLFVGGFVYWLLWFCFDPVNGGTMRASELIRRESSRERSQS